jgi:D-glycero-D-manno-heptose 1,7-bisphosphate phosphatase
VPVPGLRAISAVFLDRDGTINVKPAEGEYLTSPADLILLPGAARAVARLNAAGLRTVLVTNQRWLSGPSGDPARYAAIHARLEQLLAAQGAWLDAAYHCPHAVGMCDCRKPAPGMLRRAGREYRIELDRAVIIGDSDADLLAGRSAGTATILLRPGAAGQAAANADAVANDLDAAARLILQARHVAAGNGASPYEPAVRSRKEDHREGICLPTGEAPE